MIHIPIKIIRRIKNTTTKQRRLKITYFVLYFKKKQKNLRTSVDTAIYITTFSNLILEKNGFNEFSLNQIDLLSSMPSQKSTIFYNVTTTNYEKFGPNLFNSLNIFEQKDSEIQIRYAKYKAGILNNNEGDGHSVNFMII